jgi:DNA-binding winged helix-turn-helix (wHTH) protein
MATDPWPSGNPVVTLQFGEFTFDSASRLLLHKGVERHLSPKAQQLLHLLLEVRPRALSREQLYDALWPSTFVCETNLASIVNELRCALDDQARGSRYIRTVHRFGYAFCGEAISVAAAGRTSVMLRCEERLYVLHEGENSVGRELDADVLLSNESVSRRHAMLTVVDGAIWLEDRGSKNGTYVGGQRITTKVRVTPQTHLAFGAAGATIIIRKRPSTKSLRIEGAATPA